MRRTLNAERGMRDDGDAKPTIPHFATDEEAAEFWDTHSFTDYLHEMEPVEDVRFPRHALKQISVRLEPLQS